MKLKKFARFALILGTALILLGFAWVMSQSKGVFDDDNFPGVAMLLAGGSLFTYVLRTNRFIYMRVYQETSSLDNDLLYSGLGDFEVVRNGGFNLILALLSALGMIGLAFFSVYFLGYFLERPRWSKINEPDEIIGMVMALVVVICVVPSFIYVLRTYDGRWIRLLEEGTGPEQ